ncbi:MAG: methyltransferase domain-containing protein [Patescibacteria group bacterium]
MDELIQNLQDVGVLHSPNIITAFRAVDRKDFVPKEMKGHAYLDQALPIGMGQTISQPYTVAFMLELLAPEAGSRVMDVGSGSGWQSALLAHAVGGQPAGEGKVYAFERIPELCKFGAQNLARYPALAKHVQFFCGDASEGLPQQAKDAGGFDGIIAAAEVKEAPRAWREQLKIGGRLVYPQEHAVVKEIKKGENEFEVKSFEGFIFVPFIRDGEI